MKNSILLLTAFMLTMSLSAQTTWYVSTSGSNANTGTTAGEAFATINHAISAAACGDSIYILGGTYHEKINAYPSCPDNNRIIIQGDVLNRPLIIGDSTATNKYALGAHGKGFTFRHLELTSPYPNVCDASNMVVAGSGDDMSFIDLIIRNGGYDGMKTTSDCSTSTWANNWKVIDCQIIKNGLSCPASIQNGDGIDFTACHNCLITGTTIRDNKGHQLQIKLEARNVTVENCRIEGNLMIQIGLPGGTPQCDTTALNADSVFLRNNIIIAKGDTSEFVFKLADVSHLVIENNTIIKDSVSLANVGFICFGGCGSAANWQYPPRSPVLIRNNIFANMSATTFYAGPDTTFFDPLLITAVNVTADYNLFYDVHGEYSTPVDGGSSSLVTNPLFCNYPHSFELADNSPCINRGDPLSPLDPDSTRNDIGARYYHQACSVGGHELIYEKAVLILYPNPADEILSISLPDAQTLVRLATLTDVNGKEVLRTKHTSFAVSSLLAGLYFVRVELLDGKNVMGKIVVQ